MDESWLLSTESRRVTGVRSDGGDTAAAVTLVILALLVAIELARQPISFVTAGFYPLAAAGTALVAVAYFYRAVRPIEKFATMCAALLQVLLFGALGATLSYLLARHGGELVDPMLLRWDAALGFDWMAYAGWIDRHPAVILPLRAAYGSLIPQIVLMVCALGFSGRLETLRTAMLAAMLGGSVTILLSPLFPASGNYVSQGIGFDHFHHVLPWAMLRDVGDMISMREGLVAAIDLRAMEGIIVFPSYHACLAVVTAWGLWNSGRIFRWLGAALATLTLLATPVEGGHYLVDVLAGLAIAAAAIWIASKAIHWRFRPSPSHH
jgi:hypothetical protein